jgi:hypothetical protein
MNDEENNDTNNNPFSKKNTDKFIFKLLKPFLESVYNYNDNEIPLEIEQNNKKAIFVKTMGIMSLLFSEEPDKNIRHFREKPRMHLKPHIEKLIGN